jgi:HAD superfamily hydrolase (TIGR01509 family)
MPRLVDFLQALKTRGIKAAVCSDYPAVAKLGVLGVEKYFDVVKTAQDRDVQRFKPHPRLLEAALAALGAPAEKAVYFGDRPEVDGVAAQRAGVAFFAISPRGGFEPALKMLAREACS